MTCRTGSDSGRWAFLRGYSAAVVVGALVITLGGCSAPESSGLPEGNHPVVLLLIEGVRTDYLGCYGGAELQTPVLDQLAEESVRFEWAFAQAKDAAPSLTVMLTGLYPTTSGVVNAGDRLPEEVVTLAECAREGGMVTAAFVEGRSAGDDFGLGQGFDTFEGSSDAGAAAMEWMRQNAEGDFLLLVAGRSASPAAALDTSEAPAGYAERLQTVVASRIGDRPLLLDDKDLAFTAELYATRLSYLDAALGRFFETFRELGLDQRATLVVAAVNGLELQEHGHLFAESLHTPVTRIPLMIRFPGGRSARTVSEFVEALDLTPTLLDVLGLEIPDAIQGSSLMPLIEGHGTPPYIAFGEASRESGHRFAAMAGLRLVEIDAAGEGLLFDLVNDPLELSPLGEESADRAAVLARHLEAWGKMIAARSYDPELRTEEDLDDETLEQLRSLGYIQ